MSVPSLTLSASALGVIRTLNEAGYEAFAVGGAVRDALMGAAAKDYDVATSATPQEVHSVFPSHRLIDTGIAHGTVTVLWESEPIEVTTYRVDEGYTDSRHPDAVRFSRSLREDAARRDFTVNAMAYHPRLGLQDFFEGQEDLAQKKIRAVGNAELRFTEDALRILRGMRFASVLGFSIEKDTALAMHALKERLRLVAPERIREEFTKLLCGKGAAEVLRDYADVVAVFLPEILPMVGFDQKNPHHDYDVWEHTLRALSAAPATPHMRYALLFHDMGKPHSFSTDKSGIGHFYGHAEKSTVLADEIMGRLRFDNDLRGRVKELVRHHDLVPAPEGKQFRRLRSKFGEEFLMDYLAMVRADRSGQHAVLSVEAEEILLQNEAAAEKLLTEEGRIDARSLALTGGGLIALGMKPSKEMGALLSDALEAVLSDRLPNQKEALLAWARARLAPIECERKFLVSLFDLSLWKSKEGYGKSKITQTYLVAPEGVTARVRKREYGEKTVYTHTEKRRITAVSAIEEEQEITEEEYTRYLRDADPTRNPIAKTRHTLPYDGHLLELDVYPFWTKQAVLEIELKTEDETFTLPPEILVLREVTAEKAYKNAWLALRIPEEEP
ncbi:MAG: tRNA nucleotidyltransferase [Clostridia bacterium]|nr:tRNA nucleotidyltransferase [Clostridia bacterium]